MYFRIGRGEQVTMCKEVMPYEDWAPIAADHRFLNNVGRQFQAEEDEKWMIDVSILSLFSKILGFVIFVQLLVDILKTRLHSSVVFTQISSFFILTRGDVGSSTMTQNRTLSHDLI